MKRDKHPDNDNQPWQPKRLSLRVLLKCFVLYSRLQYAVGGGIRTCTAVLKIIEQSKKKDQFSRYWMSLSTRFTTSAVVLVSPRNPRTCASPVMPGFTF